MTKVDKEKLLEVKLNPKITTKYLMQTLTFHLGIRNINKNVT